MSRLIAYLLTIVLNQRKIMSELTNLQAAVADGIAKIEAAVAISATDKATLAAQAATIADLQTQLAAAQANATDQQIEPSPQSP